jgi:phosphonatase-like hydrolase
LQNYEEAKVKEMDGTSQVFTHLKKQGLWVALNTGYSAMQKNIIIEKLGWKQQGLIDYAISASEVERGRPAPDMIKKFNVENPGVIMKVGDTVNDILEGKNAGCGKVIGVSYGAGKPEDLSKNGADNIIDHLSELIDLIYD